jgi:hypothetical protein
LLDAGEHFVVEGFLEGLVGLEKSVGVGVFCFEVGQNAGVFFVAKPGIVVNAVVTVDDVLDRLAGGCGGKEQRGGHVFGRRSERWRVV